LVKLEVWTVQHEEGPARDARAIIMPEPRALSANAGLSGPPCSSSFRSGGSSPPYRGSHQFGPHSRHVPADRRAYRDFLLVYESDAARVIRDQLPGRGMEGILAISRAALSRPAEE